MSLLILIFLMVCFGLLFHFSFLAFKFAPFVPTPTEYIIEAFSLANLKPGETLLDLGCGTGKVLVIGAKKFNAKVIGYEISPILCFLAKLNLFINGIKNGKIYCEDFLNARLDEAEVIFLYVTPKLMEKLRKKFEKELRPKTRIITFSSQLPFWTPIKTFQPKNQKKFFKIFLYRV